ncbi:MAG: hypothetical protein L6Q71_04795, partial [Planctomycetes bacterium]|nr:hypothetical protein [Planctomycetota bacterium]
MAGTCRTLRRLRRGRYHGARTWSTRTMCRFLMYMGEPVSMASLVTEPENSLIKQSYMAKERPEPLNGDG